GRGRTRTGRGRRSSSVTSHAPRKWRRSIERKPMAEAKPLGGLAMRATIDPESRVRDAHHDALRLWLRLFTCSTLVERAIRVRLRREFNTTLPRFDLLAQLERSPEGLKMGELSKRLMVTGGNITGLTDQLVKEGLVRRQPISGDRRAFAVK